MMHVVMAVLSAKLLNYLKYFCGIAPKAVVWGNSNALAALIGKLGIQVLEDQWENKIC